MTPRDTGLSLIELVIAMAVFALVAVMGLQSLTGMLRNRDHLLTLAEDTSELGHGLAMVRNDLAAMVPMLFYPVGSAPQSAVVAGPSGFALSLGGQQGGAYPAFHRSLWRIENGTLYRRVWSTLTPANARAEMPEIAVMEGITSLSYRSYWTGLGWVDGIKNPNIPQGIAPQPFDSDTTGAAPEVYSDTLPRALSIILETTSHGPLPLIAVLK